MDKKVIYLVFIIITILSGCADTTVDDITNKADNTIVSDGISCQAQIAL